jgi:O-methyltransferase involved in polyketide biosynthesis
MQVSDSYDERHCHGLTGIAGYIVVRTLPDPSSDSGTGEVRTDVAILEGALQYLPAREQVRRLYARLTEQARTGEEFCVDVVYTDGCRMPW